MDAIDLYWYKNHYSVPGRFKQMNLKNPISSPI